MAEIYLPPSGLAEDILGKVPEQKELQLVSFRLGEEYGVPIEQVQEIVRVAPITQVPNSPEYMEGVINLRGRVLPVLNLRKRLKMKETGITKASRIVIAEINSKVIGLLVDSVSHVLKIQKDVIEPPPEEVLEVDTDYIKGVGKLGERLIILLDLERLLRKERIEIFKDVTSDVQGRIE